MVHRIDQDLDNPRQLTQAAIQVTELLGLYRADLARVLHLQCGDIGKLSSGQSLLDQHSLSWRQADLFVEFYNLLYDQFGGNGPDMCHWLRSDQDGLQATPFTLIIDDDDLHSVVTYLKILASNDASNGCESWCNSA